MLLNFSPQVMQYRFSLSGLCIVSSFLELDADALAGLTVDDVEVADIVRAAGHHENALQLLVRCCVPKIHPTRNVILVQGIADREVLQFYDFHRFLSFDLGTNGRTSYRF
jgi:hypothetical protein